MLDEKLIKVLEQRGNNFLVTGPPGSGKTHTLLELVGYLVDTKKINPEELLIFCFNRRWSKLIRGKTTSLIGSSILEIPIETFYSFCIRFINRARIFLYKNQLPDKKSCVSMDNYNPFEDLKILNSVQQWEFLKEVIKKLDEKKYPLTFKYINRNPFIENSYIQEVFDFILRSQENLFTSEELLNKFTPFFNPVLSELAGIYSRYIKKLKKNHLYNYGMLLEETVSILKNCEEIRNYYRKNYRYIVVDELQEINKAQFEIIDYLSDSNCIFFGNDDQSIYSFRGSTLDIFRSTYFKLKPENVIFLEKNYRSAGIINEVCKKFIGLVKNRIPKEIAVSDGSPQGELYLKEFHTLLEEANFICRQIKFLYLEKGVKLEEIVIIIKGLGYETHIIENALLRNGIPFTRRGTRSLLDNKLIKYLLDFMRFLVAVRDIESSKEIYTGSNDCGDSDSVLKLNNLLENIMLSEIINLEPLYFKKVKGYCSDNSGNGFINLWGYFKNEYVRKKGDKSISKELSKVNNFVSAIYRLIKIMEKKDVFEFLLILIRDRTAGIMDHLIAGKNSRISSINQWSNVSDFLSNLKDFSLKNIPGDVKAYIDFVDDIIRGKFTEEIEESTKDLIQAGTVNILSFHQCKGLEFKAVFIPFINKYYLPAKFIFTQAFDIQIFNYLNDTKKLDIEGLKKDHLYNEIRLFYNGITRAKEYLCVTSSSRRKSIFFEEIKNIYENLNSGYKKSNELRKDKDVRMSKIFKKGEKFGGIEISEAELLPDINPANWWLVRKKALVATARMQKGFKIDYRNYFNKIIVLKYLCHPCVWWDFIIPTKNGNNPFKLIPSSFSYSGIDTFRDCPFKYKIKYFFNLKEEDSISLIVGKIYHEIIRMFFKDKAGYGWEKMEKIINRVFERYYFGFKFLKRELKEKALIAFKNFFENQMPSRPDRSIVEKEFSFNLNGENIKGRIDQINFPGEKEAEIVDYKSSSSSYSDRELKEELQLKVYRMALEISKDLEDFKFMNVKMKYICLGNIKKPVYTVPDEYYSYDKVAGILSESILKIRGEEFKPRPNNYNSCLNCGFKILCPKYYG